MALYIELLGRVLVDSSLATDRHAYQSTLDGRGGGADYFSAVRHIENRICTHRESLLGSSAWRSDFLEELQTRPFYMTRKRASCESSGLSCSDDKCEACGRSSQQPDHQVSNERPSL
jgi:hypothetical protein